MHTIWFKNSDDRYEHTVIHNLDDAQRVWDTLAGSGFYMCSRRP